MFKQIKQIHDDSDHKDKVAAVLQRLRDWAAESYNAADSEAYRRGTGLMYELYRLVPMSTYVPLLPYLFALKGKPYSLNNYGPMEPLYRRTNIPRNTVLKCGRQVGKSQNLAVQGILHSAVTPYFNTIFITPLFEQIRRFSNNYVRPMIQDSPLRSVLLGDKLDTTQNVLQRSFKNESTMFFTFAFADADRIRGIAADRCSFDEIQDISADLVPVIEHCISASPYRMTAFSGTPKTKENTIQQLWDGSSQAEWVIPCSCGYSNTCGIAYDLDLMIQRKGLCCAKCGNLVNTRIGYYRHMVSDPETIVSFPGYHVPQPILPLHCENADNWREIILLKDKGNQHKYHNECLGESSDVATRLVTLTDLETACVLPWNNTETEALEARELGGFEFCTLGVDWGGGAGGRVRRSRGVLVVEGGSTSFTVATICGFKPGNPNPIILYTERMPSSWGEIGEIRRTIDLYRKFKCWRFSHDYWGAGGLRETILLQSGFPSSVIFRCAYTGMLNGPLIRYYQSPDPSQERSYYQIDKSRTLSLLCHLLKLKGIAMPRWEGVRAVAEDFLALVEDKYDRPNRPDMFFITRDPSKPDDFCHSLAYACMAQWHSTQVYPDIADLHQIQMPHEHVMEIVPDQDHRNW